MARARKPVKRPNAVGKVKGSAAVTRAKKGWKTRKAKGWKPNPNSFKKGWRTRGKTKQQYQRRAKIAKNIGHAGTVVSIGGGALSLMDLHGAMKGRPIAPRRAIGTFGVGVAGRATQEVASAAREHYINKAEHAVNAGQHPHHYKRKKIKR